MELEFGVQTGNQEFKHLQTLKLGITVFNAPLVDVCEVKSVLSVKKVCVLE